MIKAKAFHRLGDLTEGAANWFPLFYHHVAKYVPSAQKNC